VIRSRRRNGANGSPKVRAAVLRSSAAATIPTEGSPTNRASTEKVRPHHTITRRPMSATGMPLGR
jgi:hypothetical protein